MYDTFSELCLANDVLRISGQAPPHISDLAQYLRQIITAFESLRSFSDYRTPSSIRTFIHLGIFIMTLALIPFFAKLSRNPDLNVYIVYGAAFIVPLQFMLLQSIQKGVCQGFDPTPCGLSLGPEDASILFGSGDALIRPLGCSWDQGMP